MPDQRCSLLHSSPPGGGTGAALAPSSHRATHRSALGGRGAGSHRGVARRPADERFCMHCEAAGKPGLAENTQHIMCSPAAVYSGFRCSHPHLFTRPPPREVPPCAGTAGCGPPTAPFTVAAGPTPLDSPTSSPPSPAPRPAPPLPLCPLQPSRRLHSTSQAQQGGGGSGSNSCWRWMARGAGHSRPWGRQSPPWRSSSEGRWYTWPASAARASSLSRASLFQIYRYPSSMHYPKWHSATLHRVWGQGAAFTCTLINGAPAFSVR